MYRIIVMGWSRDAAIAEMTRSDHGFHRLWTNLVSYVREADVERIRRRAGL